MALVGLNVVQAASECINSPLVDDSACFYEAGHPKQRFCQAIFARLKGRKRFKDLAISNEPVDLAYKIRYRS